MKLLFDQNLSPRLPRLLADIYAGSLHIRELGLSEADDAAIWEYAKAHGFAIVFKGLRFSATKPVARSTPKVYMAAGRELHRSPNGRPSANLFCCNTQLRSGPVKVAPHAAVAERKFRR